MKKKITAICLCVALVAVAVVGASLAYFTDTDDATTKAFLDEVDQLSQQNISMDLPETLQSQAMLEKLMQTRVRNLLAQPAAGTTEAKPAPAPQADTPAAAPQGE